MWHVHVRMRVCVHECLRVCVCVQSLSQSRIDVDSCVLRSCSRCHRLPVIFHESRQNKIDANPARSASSTTPLPFTTTAPPPSRWCCALPKCKQTHTDSDRDWKLHVPPQCADSPQNLGSCCDFPPLSTPSGKWHARHVEVFPALSVRTRRCRRQHVQSSCYSSSVPQCEVNQN